MPRRNRKHMARICLASVARPDCTGSIRQRNRTILAKIDDRFYLRVETVHVPWLVIHRVRHKPYAAESDRSHLLG